MFHQKNTCSKNIRKGNHRDYSNSFYILSIICLIHSRDDGNTGHWNLTHSAETFLFHHDVRKGRVPYFLMTIAIFEWLAHTMVLCISDLATLA